MPQAPPGGEAPPAGEPAVGGAEPRERFRRRHGAQQAGRATADEAPAGEGVGEPGVQIEPTGRRGDRGGGSEDAGSRGGVGQRREEEPHGNRRRPSLGGGWPDFLRASLHHGRHRGGGEEGQLGYAVDDAEELLQRRGHGAASAADGEEGDGPEALGEPALQQKLLRQRNGAPRRARQAHAAQGCATAVGGR